MLQCVAVCDSVLQCVAVCDSVLLKMMCIRGYIIETNAHVPASHTQHKQTQAYRATLLKMMCIFVCCSVLQCVAVCCSVLQCVAVCCSVLQCVIKDDVHFCLCVSLFI